MRVLVTGASGYIGSLLIEKLQQNPFIEKIIAVDVKKNIKDNEKVEFFYKDIRDPEICTLIRIYQINVVIHLASIVNPPKGMSKEEQFSIDVKGTENILLSCKKLGIKKLIYTSTPSVVYDEKGIEGGNENLPYSEKFLTYYPETKAIAEKMILEANSKELQTVVLRPHLIWGPEDHHFLPRLISKAKKGKLFLIGNGNYLVDTVYIDNAAYAHILAYEKLNENSDISGKAYFITQGEPIRISDLINKILECANIKPIKKSINKDFAYYIACFIEDFYKFFNIEKEPPLTRFVVKQLSTPHWFDISSAKNELGYFPKVSLEEGMNRMKNWLESINKNNNFYL